MLEFFRKYQRYFFIFIAVVVVISFSFFGIHQGVTSSSEEIQDYPIGSAVDGSQMRKKEIDEIYRFIQSDRADMQLIERRMIPNFFNNGVIRKDFLSSGLGVILADRYFEKIANNFKNRIDQHKKFRPYQHPTIPFIGVEMLWNQILPKQKVQLDQFLHEKLPIDSHLFSLLVDLYLGETAFPPNILRQYLSFQEKQCKWAEPDPGLSQANLSLFHCSTLEDWFGMQFLELASQFIHNAAIIAQEKGYHVSTEQVRVDLFRIGHEALQMQKKSQEVSEAELSDLWKQQLLHLGMNEKAVLTVWKKVMLMRRLFEDYGYATFIDSHQDQTFHSYASKTARIDHYELPPPFQLRTFNELLKLTYYLDIVSAQKQNGTEFPNKLASVDSIKKQCPTLVQNRFLVELTKVKKEDLAQDVSLKQMWEWELHKENFKRLQEEFPELAQSKATDGESYFLALEDLSPSIRKKLDHFARMQIVDRHPDWIIAALDQQTCEIKELPFDANGNIQLHLEGIESGKELSKSLREAALKGAIDADHNAQKARVDLELFTEDQKTYYRFQVLDKDEHMDVLTFAQANERGLLDALVDRYLEDQYAHLKTEYPALFQTQSGDWKPFKDVKYDVGRLLYKDVLHAIDHQSAQRGEELKPDRFENLDAFYPSRYLYHYMELAKADISQNEGASHFLAKPLPVQKTGALSPKPELADQWQLIQETKTYRNYEGSPYFDSSLFEMDEKQWSDINCSKDGKLHFFRLEEKQQPQENYVEEIKKGREILSIEAQRFLMTEILEELKKKQAIHLSLIQDAK